MLAHAFRCFRIWDTFEIYLRFSCNMLKNVITYITFIMILYGENSEWIWLHNGRNMRFDSSNRRLCNFFPSLPLFLSIASSSSFSFDSSYVWPHMRVCVCVWISVLAEGKKGICSCASAAGRTILKTYFSLATLQNCLFIVICHGIVENISYEWLDEMSWPDRTPHTLTIWNIGEKKYFCLHIAATHFRQNTHTQKNGKRKKKLLFDELICWHCSKIARNTTMNTFLTQFNGLE